jgi:hypothetical protein
MYQARPARLCSPARSDAGSGELRRASLQIPPQRHDGIHRPRAARGHHAGREAGEREQRHVEPALRNQPVHVSFECEERVQGQLLDQTPDDADTAARI